MTTHFIAPRRSVRRLTASPFHSDWNAAFNVGSLHRVFGDTMGTTNGPATPRGFSPNVDVSESDQELCFSVELPGVEQDAFEVLVDADVLIIKGEKQAASREEGDQYRRVERSSGSFERKFQLGWDVDADKLEATYKNGVLEVRIPKPVEEQPAVRSIPVTAS
jgi:HSP20 family protein